MKRVILSLFVGMGLAHAAPDRLISLGGSVTEVVYALGQEGRLVATDNSSLYPKAATELPQVGYYRQIATEGLASLSPTHILASEHAGPKKALEDLEKLGVSITTIVDKPDINVMYQRIEQIAKTLNVPEKGQALVQKVKKDVEEASSLPSSALNTIFIINRTGAFMSAGDQTAANELMRLSGVKNFFAHQKGFKPLSAESLLDAKPELILVTEFSIKASGGLEKFKALPAIAESPAAKNGRIVVLDDLLAMGLGPRSGEAIRQIKMATK